MAKTVASIPVPSAPQVRTCRRCLEAIDADRIRDLPKARFCGTCAEVMYQHMQRSAARRAR